MRGPGALLLLGTLTLTGAARADDLMLRHRMVVTEPPSTGEPVAGETRTPTCRTTSTFTENKALRETTTVTHRHCE